MEELYNKVVAGNVYNYHRAYSHNLKLFKEKTVTKKMPGIELDFISKYHCGCCLHYGMALFKLMRDAGYEAYIAITAEENPITHDMSENHVSVCYIKNGQKFIADPFETVRSGKIKYFDIPIEKFAQINGTVKLYDPYGEYGNELFYENFLNYPIEIFKG